LPALLDSIVSQSYRDFEIVICEDKSPERDDIREIVKNYAKPHSNLINYYENESNLGYDANLRNLFDKARGDYCFIMGNDDLMCPGALAVCGEVLKHYPNIGVMFRSYAWFNNIPSELDQVVHYFTDERFFPAGPATVVTFFRRVGSVSGIVIHREAAKQLSTKEFDGTLFYQMYLVANILLDLNGVYIPKVTVLCRNSEPPDFGNSMSEKGKFIPGSYSPSSRVHMIKSILDIAKSVERSRKVLIYSRIVSDIGNYSYPILAYHAHEATGVFWKYYLNLSSLGLWSNLPFNLYFFVLLVFGKKRSNRIIIWIRRRIKYTPVIGSLYKGQINHSYNA
jgi:glycosyltransferase involved in cell wall biosynthesis